MRVNRVECWVMDTYLWCDPLWVAGSSFLTSNNGFMILLPKATNILQLSQSSILGPLFTIHWLARQGKQKYWSKFFSPISNRTAYRTFVHITCANSWHIFRVKFACRWILSRGAAWPSLHSSPGLLYSWQLIVKGKWITGSFHKVNL